MRLGITLAKPVEIMKPFIQTLKEKRRLNGRGREKHTVAAVNMIMMLKKRIKKVPNARVTAMRRLW